MEKKSHFQLFGEIPVHQEKGLVRWRYEIQREHHNTNGALHGGVLSTLMDTAMGHAAWTLSGGNENFIAAISLNVFFLQAVRAETGVLTVEGRVVRGGKRVAFTEAVVRDDAGTEYARATGTQAILKRDARATER